MSQSGFFLLFACVTLRNEEQMRRKGEYMRKYIPAFLPKVCGSHPAFHFPSFLASFTLSVIALLYVALMSEQISEGKA